MDDTRTAEHALLRGALYVRFGQSPLLAEGVWLRTRLSTPEARQPRIPPAVANMLAYGLLELRPARIRLAAYFIEAGVPPCACLHRTAALKPIEFAHVRQQLGLDPALTEPPGYRWNLG